MNTMCAFIVVATTLIGCAAWDESSDGTTGVASSAPSLAVLPIDRPCDNKREGDLCGGSANDPIHGECDTGSPKVCYNQRNTLSRFGNVFQNGG